jgi:hypothetical protein
LRSVRTEDGRVAGDGNVPAHRPCVLERIAVVVKEVCGVCKRRVVPDIVTIAGIGTMRTDRI